ncbi:MAG: hypothetical protein RR829_03855 [Oscillospiraceae bacterium]
MYDPTKTIEEQIPDLTEEDKSAIKQMRDDGASDGEIYHILWML